MLAISPKIESLNINISTADIAPKPVNKNRGDLSNIMDIDNIIAKLDNKILIFGQ